MPVAVSVSVVYVTIMICVIVIYGAIELYREGIRYKKDAKAYAEKIKKQTDMKYNRYASLEPDKLNLWLSNIFAQFLELAADAKITVADHNASIKLYAEALNMTIKYIGTETVDAINYYYGRDYVIRYCEMQYKLLEHRSTISKIISNDIIVSSEITKTMAG